MNLEPCTDCTSLVGAGPAIEPHKALLSYGTDPAGLGVYRCDSCQCRWGSGSPGWSRLED